MDDPLRLARLHLMLTLIGLILICCAALYLGRGFLQFDGAHAPIELRE